jgi:hypothetical protein
MNPASTLVLNVRNTISSDQVMVAHFFIISYYMLNLFQY